MPLPLIEPQTQRQSIHRVVSSPLMPHPNPATAGTILEFGRFQVLLRRRVLLADGVPIELGTRAFEVLLALLEADGELVSKNELLSRVWPSVVVAEDNLKVQISALRKALGEDRHFIRTEFGRGYRFTATVHPTEAWNACQRSPLPRRPSERRPPASSAGGRSFRAW
jgi:DNA-binding winged helix-turn-helix (wHTH) protein